MTNNPRKIVGLDGYGLKVTKRVPLVIKPNPQNKRYLNTKRHKLGHLSLYILMKKKSSASALSSRNSISNTPTNFWNVAGHELIQHGVAKTSIDVVWVPGAYELPFMAHQMAKRKRYHAVICLGCIIKGETSHDEHIATWASIGVGQASLLTGVPILFGVLTPNNEAQARAGPEPGPLNRGEEVAKAALRIKFDGQVGDFLLRHRIESAVFEGGAKGAVLHGAVQLIFAG